MRRWTGSCPFCRRRQARTMDTAAQSSPFQSIPAGRERERERGVPESNHVPGLPHTYMSCRISMVWPGGSPSTCPARDRGQEEGSTAQHSTARLPQPGQVRSARCSSRPAGGPFSGERSGSCATRIAPTLSSGGESNSRTVPVTHT